MFKLKEIVYFTDLNPEFEDKNGVEVQVIKLEGWHNTNLEGSQKMFGYSVRDAAGHPWIVKRENIKRSHLERGDMDTIVSWYQFTLATGISKPKQED